MRRETLIGLTLACACVAFHSPQDEPHRSASKVKVTATATKPDADGKQTVTITLDIAKGWFLYANPVNNEFLESAEVRVRVKAKESVKTTVKYPTGSVYSFGKDKEEQFNQYEGVVKIQADVVRTKGDTGPLA